MADLKTYLALTADMKIECVDTERLKCANANCPRIGLTRNRIDAAQLLAQYESGVHGWVRLYFCDECYPRYKAIIKDERPKCATLNCTREGNALNIVRGKLDLSPASDGKGPSIWIDAYLCDFCAERVAQGLPPYANKPLGLMEAHKCLE